MSGSVIICGIKKGFITVLKVGMFHTGSDERESDNKARV